MYLKRFWMFSFVPSLFGFSSFFSVFFIFIGGGVARFFAQRSFSDDRGPRDDGHDVVVWNTGKMRNALLMRMLLLHAVGLRANI